MTRSDTDSAFRSPGNRNPASTAQASLRRLRALPPLPATSQQLLELLSDPDLDMLRLAEIIEQTPALAARILGVANSAFFAQAKGARDVPDAIIRVLGLHLVRDLSISFALSQPFDPRECPRFDARRYWISAMESAVLAQLVGARLPVADSPTPAEAYLGGLLNNLGLLALVHVVPDAMDEVFSSIEREPTESLRAREQRIVGLDHAAAGAELATVWRLPTLLRVAMGPRDPRPTNHAHRILRLILQLCHQIRHCALGGEEPGESSAVLETWFELGVPEDALDDVIARWGDRRGDISDLATAFLGAGS